MKHASIRENKEALVEALQLFECCLDPDVQDFLNNKAIDFEKKGLATTYLLLSKDKFDEGIIDVEGYFSLTHKAVTLCEDVSKSLKKKIGRSTNTQVSSFVLIGQLGKKIIKKDENVLIASELSATELLNDALSIIQESSEFIVCRNIIIECKPIDKVKQIYEDYGFTNLQYDSKEKLHTLYLKLENSVVF